MPSFALRLLWSRRCHDACASVRDWLHNHGGNKKIVINGATAWKCMAFKLRSKIPHSIREMFPIVAKCSPRQAPKAVMFRMFRCVCGGVVINLAHVHSKYCHFLCVEETSAWLCIALNHAGLCVYMIVSASSFANNELILTEEPMMTCSGCREWNIWRWSLNKF